MKIKRITLKNFRNHEHTLIDFASPISVITGLNASGKSAIKEAIIYALTGDGRNEIARKDLNNLISYGKAKAEVEIIISASNTTLKITRCRTSAGESLKLEENDVSSQGTPSQIQQRIYDLLGVDKQTLLFAFDGRLIYQLSSADLKTSIFDLLKIRLTEEDLANELKNTSMDASYWKELVSLAINKGFQEANKEAIWQRKCAKRELKDEIKPVPDKASIGDREYFLPEIDIQEVTQHLNSLKKEKDELLVQKGKLQAQSEHDPKELKMSQNYLTNSLKEYEKQLQESKDKDYQKDKSTTIEQINEYSQKLTQSQKELTEATVSFESKEKMLNGDFSGQCPYFPDLACGSSDQIKEREAQIQKEIEDLKKQIEKANIQVTNCQYMIRIKNDYLNRLNEEIENQKTLEKRVADFKDELSKVNQKLAEQKKKEEQNTATPLKAVEEKINQLDIRIGVGTELTSKVTEWSGYQEKIKNRAKLEEKVKVYDTLADFFSSDGYMKKMLSRSLAPLYDRLKETQEILGYPIRFDQEFNILADGRPITNLSESERYRLGIILQDAFIHLTNLRIMLIDEVNILDQYNKGVLVQTLIKLCEDYDNILLFSTTSEVQPKPSTQALINIVMVDHGKIYPILKKAA